MKLLKLLPVVFLLPAATFAAEGESRWNGSINPIALVVGPNLRFEYKLNDHMTLGPSANLVYINAGGLKANGYSVGADMKYYFNEALVEHTWWLGAGLHYGSAKFKYTEDRGKESNADVRTASLPIMGGYQWFWNHFNLALGVGPSINYISSREIIDENGNKKKDIPYVPVGVAADASLGWTF